MCCARGTRPRTSGMLRQPSQPFDRLIADDDDLGIDEGHGIAFAAAVGIEHRHEDPQALVHLRRRQPDARILVHRVDHAVDELLDRRRS